MPERTYSRESEIDATRTSARLPGLDIDIIHRRSPNSDWEQMSINLRATPSFEALGSLFEAANPFTFWVPATRFMWTPWLLAGPLTLSLDAKMSAHLLESDLDLPAADEPSDDVLWLGVEIGCEEGLRVELAGWIADQKPSDRHRRHAAAIPDGGAGCELDEPIGSAVPQADAAMSDA